MKFTDIFIRRPVLACVVSLMLLVVGLKAFYALPILEYPKTENAVITITTVYYGADPETVAGFVTTPLENAIAQANGIDYLSSNSRSGTSTITATLVLNFDPDKAITEINSKINSVLNQLPVGVQQPTLSVTIGQSLDALIIGFASDELSPNQITDYLIRNVQPRLQAVPGVQTAELLGGQNFALRAWLDPAKLDAYGLTATDVTNALSANNVIAGIGTTKGQMVQLNLTASTNLHSAQEFRNLVVKQVNGGIIRLSDVANVTLGSDDYESSVEYNGKKGVYIGIQTVPSASLLAVVGGVKAVLPSIQQQLPAGLSGDVIYDSTVFVNSSINEVERSLAETVVIVTLVVFAFLGSPRSVIIPVVTIPLSLIGTFAVMLALGFGAGDRAGGGRRHHRGGKRQPPPGRGHETTGRRDACRARPSQPDHRHDDRIDRRLRADRLSGRPDRSIVHRVRLHRRRCRNNVRRRRADAIADDVRLPAQAAHQG
jgi:multidrug efflux pump